MTGRRPYIRTWRFVALLACVLAVGLIAALYLSGGLRHLQAAEQSERNAKLWPIYVTITPSKQVADSAKLHAPFVRRADGETGFSVLALEEMLCQKLPGSSFRQPCGFETHFLWLLHANLSLDDQDFYAHVLHFSPSYWQNLECEDCVIGEPPLAEDRPQVFLGRHTALKLSQAGFELKDLVNTEVELTLAFPVTEIPEGETGLPMRMVTIPAEVSGVATRELTEVDRDGRLATTAKKRGMPYGAGWVNSNVINLAWLKAVAAEINVSPPESLFVYSLTQVFKDRSSLSDESLASLSRYEERQSLLVDYYSTGKLSGPVEDFVSPREFKIGTYHMKREDVAALVATLEELGFNTKVNYPKVDIHKEIKRLQNILKKQGL